MTLIQLIAAQRDGKTKIQNFVLTFTVISKYYYSGFLPPEIG